MFALATTAANQSPYYLPTKQVLYRDFYFTHGLIPCLFLHSHENKPPFPLHSFRLFARRNLPFRPPLGSDIA